MRGHKLQRNLSPAKISPWFSSPEILLSLSVLCINQPPNIKQWQRDTFTVNMLTSLSYELENWVSSQNWSEFNQESISVSQMSTSCLRLMVARSRLCATMLTTPSLQHHHVLPPGPARQSGICPRLMTWHMNVFSDSSSVWRSFCKDFNTSEKLLFDMIVID